jgi:hypothetical protein
MQTAIKVIEGLAIFLLFSSAVLGFITAFKLIASRKDGVGIDEILMRSWFIEPKLQVYVEPSQVDWLRRSIKLLRKLLFFSMGLLLLVVLGRVWQ